MRVPVILTAAMALAGCMAATTRPEAAIPVKSRCHAEAASGLIGEPGTSDLAAEALNRTGARVVRWIWPDMIVTLDLRIDRLNIDLDAAGRVTRFGCG